MSRTTWTGAPGWAVDSARSSCGWSSAISDTTGSLRAFAGISSWPRTHHASLPQGGVPQTTVQALVDRARHEVHPKLAELVAATSDLFVQTIADVVVPRTVF